MKLGTVGRSVRIGVIGLGCRGIPQLDVLLSMPDVEVVINGDYVREHLRGENKPMDMKRYIL